MTVTSLPSTLSGLRTAIERGDLAMREAVAAQLGLMRADHPAVVKRHVHSVEQLNALVDGGPLSGVVLAHKDIFDLPDMFPGCGWPESIAPNRPRRMAEALRRLETAGAVNAAALAMAEFACGSTSENPHMPALFNPLDEKAVVGGSSSGSAAAVASGYCYASLGTDTFGSVRIPAATCGLFGFKPGHGRVPVDGVAPLAPSLDTVGVLAMDADDAALVYRGLMQTPASVVRSIERQDWRLACLIESAGLDAAVGDALAEFADGLGALARVTTVPRSPAPELKGFAQVILHVEAFHAHREGLAEIWPALAPATRSVLGPGLAIPETWYRTALERRNVCYERFVSETMGEADFLLIPALPRTVPDARRVHRASADFDARELLALHEWMPWANYLGMPAAVMLIGWDDQARPIAAQIMAQRGRDDDLLTFCRAIQQRIPSPFRPQAVGQSVGSSRSFH